MTIAKETKATLERSTLDVIADRGYFSSEEILECDKAGITVTLPKPMTSNPKRFGKQDFRYVAEEDVSSRVEETDYAVQSRPILTQPQAHIVCCTGHDRS